MAEIVEAALTPRFSGLADAAERPARSSRARSRPVAKTGSTPERGAKDVGENMNGDPDAEAPVAPATARAGRRAPVRTGAAPQQSVVKQDVLSGDDGSGT